MKFRLQLCSGLGLLMMAITVSMAAQTSSSKPSHYIVIDLGTFGGTYSSAYGLSEAGEVAGGAANSTDTDGIAQKGFIWNGTKLINVGNIGGSTCSDCSSEAGGPNSSGASAIVSETPKPAFMNEDFCGFGTHRQCLAAVWQNGNLKGLPNLKGGRNGQAYWINAHGQLTGFSENGVMDSTCSTSVPFQELQFEAVIWGPEGNVRELKPLPGDTVGFAFGVNDAGQAVGGSGLCSNTSLPPVSPGAPHAVLWESNGTPTDLGSLQGQPFNVATSINNLGQVAGVSLATDGTKHSFYWTKSAGMTDLGTMPNAIATVAPCCHTLNNKAQITGFWIDDQFNMTAYLWQNGVMTDLNTLIPADSGWYLLGTAGINDAGQIAGFGVNPQGEVHAFLASPCSDSCAEGVSHDDSPAKRPMPPVPDSVRQFINRQIPRDKK